MEKHNSRVVVVGAGYVGLATAVVDADRLAALANGQIRFHEPPAIASAFPDPTAARFPLSTSPLICRTYRAE